MLYTVRDGFPSIRPLSGMSLAGSCAAYFWLGWGAWTVAGWLLLFAEYTFRVPDPPAAYLVEAGLAMLGWIIALAVADQVAVSHYRAAWHLLRQMNLAPELLSVERLSRIRQDLRRILILNWIAPPRTADLGSQLYAATLWFQAMSQPLDASPYRRYGEWMLDILFGFLLPATAGAAALLWPTRYGLATATLLTAFGLVTLGYSSIRFAVRRQAVCDYFSAWR